MAKQKPSAGGYSLQKPKNPGEVALAHVGAWGTGFTGLLQA
jgi:hypothetical protein